MEKLPTFESGVFIVRATRKLLDVVGRPDLSVEDADTTALGPWYATRMPWRVRTVLLVSESTLLPVLMPLSPAAGWPSRIAAQLATVLAAHDVPAAFIDTEVQAMREYRLGPTASRRVIGIMNEFVHLAEAYRSAGTGADLVDLSMRLSRTPCSPLYARHISPDRELATIARTHQQPDHHGMDTAEEIISDAGS